MATSSPVDFKRASTNQRFHAVRERRPAPPLLAPAKIPWQNVKNSRNNLANPLQHDRGGRGSKAEKSEPAIAVTGKASANWPEEASGRMAAGQVGSGAELAKQSKGVAKGGATAGK